MSSTDAGTGLGMHPNKTTICIWGVLLFRLDRVNVSCVGTGVVSQIKIGKHSILVIHTKSV